MNTAKLDDYREPFKALVLSHLNRLPGDEWLRFRSIARDSIRRVVPDQWPADTTPEALLDGAVYEDSISVALVLATGLGKSAVEIGDIEGKPVHYIEGEGVYLWGLYPEDGFSLSLWATHPAYPTGW